MLSLNPKPAQPRCMSSSTDMHVYIQAGRIFALLKFASKHVLTYSGMQVLASIRGAPHPDGYRCFINGALPFAATSMAIHCSLQVSTQPVATATLTMSSQPIQD